MKFWGVHVIPGETCHVPVLPEEVLNVTKVALLMSGDEPEPLYVNVTLIVDGTEYPLATLNHQTLPQQVLDDMLDRSFSISHNWKKGIVSVTGYKTEQPDAEDVFLPADYVVEDQGLAWDAKEAKKGSGSPKDAVEAAMDEHGPDASHFDLWEKATGGKKKGKLVGLGTQGEPRLMVTSRTSISSSSSQTGSQPSEQVQKLEEMVRRLQDDNAQMRMQGQVQQQVESQLQEHMRQWELEAKAREEAREREWQRKMEDINLMLKKYSDPRPPQ